MSFLGIKMPVSKNFTGILGIPNIVQSMSPIRSFLDGFIPYYEERNLKIFGITRDSTGAAIGNCIVLLYDKNTNLYQDFTISDANGNYSIDIPKGLSQPQTTTWYIVAYKAGAPDIAGTTVNTLTGS
jgi:hypothetical protein